MRGGGTYAAAMAHNNPFVLAAALLVLSCTADSASIDTREFDVNFEVTVTDSPKPRTNIDVYLTAGLKDIDLGEGDELHVITDRGDDLRLVEDSDLFDGFYGIELPGVTDLTTFKLELRRAGQTSALGTSLTIPGALELDASPNGKTFAVGDEIDLRWANPAEGTTMYVSSAPCGGASFDSDGADPIPDKGSLLIAVRDLIVGEPDAQGSCIELHIERSGAAESVIDPILDEMSEIEAHRHAMYTITVTP